MNKEQIKKIYDFMVNLMKNWGLKETLIKVIAGILIGIILTLTGCKNINQEQINAVHDLYHAISDKPCVFEVEETDK